MLVLTATPLARFYHDAQRKKGVLSFSDDNRATLCACVRTDKCPLMQKQKGQTISEFLWVPIPSNSAFKNDQASAISLQQQFLFIFVIITLLNVHMVKSTEL